MPDISKINALAIGSVGKVDGLAKASILDIDGVSIPADNAPAAAFSVRLLGSAFGISSYTGDCMRVRRASDNVEADIAFDAGELKLTSGVSNTSDGLSYTDFADFVDHTGTPTDAFCRTWYDQSGNSNDAGQSTAGSQPQIYDATTGLITENGKPAIDFDGPSQQMLELTSSVTCQTLIMVTKVGTGSIDMSWGSGGDFSHRSVNGDYVLDNATINDWFDESNGDSYINGTQVTGRPSGTTQHVYFGWNTSPGSAFNQFSVDVNIGGTQRSWDGPLQETILYTNTTYTDSTNRSNIETDINGFFSIY